MTETHEAGGRHAWPEFGAAVRIPAAIRRPGAAQAAQAEYENGYEAGKAAGLAAAAEEIRALKERLGASIRTLEQTRIRVDAQQQQQLVELTHAICGKVLGIELSTDLHVFETFVRGGIEHLEASSETVRVHVNPNDGQWLEAKFPGIVIEADESVAEGGCSVRTEQRSVDFDPYGLLDDLFAELPRG
jgi:flagellar biosynthesis/type III secretory pathway protein FliH